MIKTILKVGSVNSDSLEEDILNELGEEGWELVNVIVSGDFRVLYLLQEIHETKSCHEVNIFVPQTNNYNEQIRLAALPWLSSGWTVEFNDFHDSSRFVSYAQGGGVWKVRIYHASPDAHPENPMYNVRI